jgi:hypothetical protein
MLNSWWNFPFHPQTIPFRPLKIYTRVLGHWAELSPSCGNVGMTHDGWGRGVADRQLTHLFAKAIEQQALQYAIFMMLRCN